MGPREGWTVLTTMGGSAFAAGDWAASGLQPVKSPSAQMPAMRATIDGRALRSPSPQSSPSGRGSTLWPHLNESQLSGCRMSGEMFSLSPGERAGVRAELISTALLRPRTNDLWFIVADYWVLAALSG